MREISVNELFPASVETMWNLFSDIEHYPKYVHFVKSVEIVKGIKEGGMWYDISTIMFLPWRYDHYITKFEKNKEIEFTVYLTTGGKIVQNFSFKQNGEQARIVGYVTIDLGWKILDFFLGSFLEQRMQMMVNGTIKNAREALR